VISNLGEVETGLDQRVLARKAGVPLSVVHRAESSPGEPVITITQLNALMQALRAAGASFSGAAPDPNARDG
jgi:hypothetical protein